MLFGNEKFKERVLNEAQKFAGENNYELIYGAVIGSISKGLQYEDSDFDSRFLYIDKGNRDCLRPTIQEKDLFYKDSVFDVIHFWDLFSVIQFLREPQYEGKVSYETYNAVGWTLQSPYVWDPYGLQMKLVPLINSLFRKDYLIPYHIEQIKIKFSEESQIVIKKYLYAIYAALCIKWACEKESFPPVYMRTLLSSVAPISIKKKVIDMIDLSKKLSKEYLANPSEMSMRTTHNMGKISHDPEIDEFIREMLQQSEQMKPDNIHDEILQDKIDGIYDILRHSLNSETKVRGVN